MEENPPQWSNQNKRIWKNLDEQNAQTNFMWFSYKPARIDEERAKINTTQMLLKPNNPESSVYN